MWYFPSCLLDSEEVLQDKLYKSLGEALAREGNKISRIVRRGSVERTVGNMSLTKRLGQVCPHLFTYMLMLDIGLISHCASADVSRSYHRGKTPFSKLVV